MSFNLDKITRENVKGLSPYSSARDEYVSDGSTMVFLDANENPFENGVNRYPDPQQRGLKAILAEQKGIKEENILLGNGSDEVLDLLFRAFCEPKQDNIITLPPTYGMYKVLSGINLVENREVLLTNDFQPNVEGILNIIDNNKTINTNRAHTSKSQKTNNTSNNNTKTNNSDEHMNTNTHHRPKYLRNM